jgi:hypothetical protein
VGHRPGPSSWGLNARLTILLYKTKYCCLILRSENQMAKLRGFSKESYSSKSAVLPMIMMMMMTILETEIFSFLLCTILYTPDIQDT